MDIAQYSVTQGDIEFLAQKEREGNLVSSISSEFTGNADQISITPVSGKTFYLVGIKLYPVVNSVATIANTTTNRRTDIELTFDGTIKDVLTHDAESITQAANGYGAGQQTGQYEGNMRGISMAGDGVKIIKLTSTNTSGTYRVSILGYYETT